MNDTILQINETEINELFNPVNNAFKEFQTFSSNLFSQIMDWFTLMLQNLPE